VAYPTLEAAWAKCNRATRDLRVLHDNAGRFLNDKPYRLAIELDPHSGWWLIRTQIVQEPPPVLGALVGSMAHQLYSALNHITWGLTVRKLGAKKAEAKRKRVAFPICYTERAFLDAGDASPGAQRGLRPATARLGA
jgi:hypothetical protein